MVSPLDTAGRDLPALMRETRRQLGLSQEDLARELGISFVTVNRWENRQSKPSRLAKAQLGAFCEKMIRRGALIMPDNPRP